MLSGIQGVGHPVPSSVSNRNTIGGGAVLTLSSFTENPVSTVLRAIHGGTFQCHSVSLRATIHLPGHTPGNTYQKGQLGAGVWPSS